MSTAQATQAKAIHEYELLAKNNVVGVGVGYKETNGVYTDDVAVIVLVEQKKPMAALQPEDTIPRDLQGMRTDVIEVGFLRAYQGGRDRFRPVIPSGVSIGHYKVTAGTLGTIVRDRRTGEGFLLSNNHVFANSNDAQLGDAILQPAAMDGGNNPADLVARLERFAKLLYTDDPAGLPEIIGLPPSLPPVTPTQPPTTKPPMKPVPVTPPADGTNNGCGNLMGMIAGLINALGAMMGSRQRVITTTQAVAQALASSSSSGPVSYAQRLAAQSAIPENRADCALARPIDLAAFSDDIRQIGIVNAAKPPVLGMRVRKYGRTTEYTEGSITLLNATVNIAYNTSRGQRTARFINQVIAGGMSAGGDSGSLVIDAASNHAIGLLFAGSPQATIFTPIQTVLDMLNIDL